MARANKVGILILGPSGSGKSFLARAFHYESARRSKPFVVFDCSQVTSTETLGAELFGYAPRSGFGAPTEGRPGKAQLAHEGTLFIDEIGSLPLELQQRLLRLIQDGRFSPLGTGTEQEVDIQVIAGTNADLGAMVQQRRFREDLYWRIRELVVVLPPLNKRPADIPLLANRFLASACERFGQKKKIEIADDALLALTAVDWSTAGNIRGLEHTINRSVLLAGPDKHLLAAADIAFDPLFDFQPAGTAQNCPSPEPQLVAGPPPSADASPTLSPRAESPRTVCERKIDEHDGVLSAMAQDPELARACGYRSGPVPVSSLRHCLRRAGLENHLAAARRRAQETASLPAVISAIRTHRSAGAAAGALGITRDAVFWRLRKAGLTVRQILTEGGDAEGS